MAVYVERSNTFKRLLKRRVEELQSELQCRLLHIEQTQYEILKTFGNQFDIIAKYSYTLSPRKRRRLLAEMNLHHTGGQGHTADKQTILKHYASEKDIFDHQKCGCHGNGSHITDCTDHDKLDKQYELNLLRSKISTKRVTKKGIKEDDYAKSFDNDRSEQFKRGISFSDRHMYDTDRKDKTIDASLKRNSSFTTARDVHAKQNEVDGSNADANLTAFAFSRHSLNHNGTPLKRRTFDTSNNERLKRGIRTKVVQNYLLCDVFKRLSDRNSSLARMKIDGRPEDSGDEGHYTCDVVKDLQHCRYLRVPKSLQEAEEEKLTKVDID